MLRVLQLMRDPLRQQPRLHPLMQWRGDGSVQDRILRCSHTRGERPHNARGLSRVIAHRGQGVVPLQVEAALASISSAQHWLEVFERHLEQVAGVSADRLKTCLLHGRGLLRAAFWNSDPDFNELRADIRETGGNLSPTSLFTGRY